MDFMNRSNSPAQTPNDVSTNSSFGAGQSHSGGQGHKDKNKSFPKSIRVASVALLFSATVLVVALVVLLAFGGQSSEKKHVNEDRLQAVFLNGGQVYFGTIRDINDKHIRLTNIFYLRVDQQVQPEQEGQAQAQNNDISLVKLGCELHRPTDEMLISREQVIFWENLKDDEAQNTVPGAVKAYIKQFPNGQECEEQDQQGVGAQSEEAEVEAEE
jgi:hypothetical protein